MAAVKGGGMYGKGIGVGAPPEPQWERTPRLMFWRPYWRRYLPFYNRMHTRGCYDYRTKRQLAHEFLREKFNDEADASASPATDSRRWNGRF